ncbi:MAG: hypothetical protein GX957_07880 [Clostridiaceae bacterium]|nr:hypothetical protein [Clostridiaceae bacterium]
MSRYIIYANINDLDIIANIHSQSLIAPFKGIIPEEFLYENFSSINFKAFLHQNREILNVITHRKGFGVRNG